MLKTILNTLVLTTSLASVAHAHKHLFARPQEEVLVSMAHLNRAVIEKDPAVPVIICPQARLKSTPEEQDKLIENYNISFYPSEQAIVMSPSYESFLYELNKFPLGLLKEMKNAGATIRLIQGNQGVTSDPSWEEEREYLVKKRIELEAYYAKHRPWQRIPGRTVEQINSSYMITRGPGMRDWSEVSGAGGSVMKGSLALPTRLVVDEMYARKNDAGFSVRQGTVNLFLHEHAHTLNSLKGAQSISTSVSWRKAMKDPRSIAYTKKIFSTYEQIEEEGFAELFAYYYSCDAARNQITEHAPAIASFFRRFKSTEPFGKRRRYRL